MAKWRVWNKHSHGLTHKEQFRGETVEIQAGKYIVMDYEDAVLFRGQFFPMKTRPSGEPDPVGFKMIFIEPDTPDDKVALAAKKFICHLDGREFPNQRELDEYVKANFADQTFTDESIEEEIKKTNSRRKKEA